MTELLPEGAPASAKPRTASLLKSMALDTVTLDDALKLLSLPRVLGELDGEQVTVQNGRYGPYAKKGTDSRSLESEDQLFTLTLAEAKELFAQPKARGRRTGAAAPPLRELGEDPATGKPMVIKDGRFGPYVTDGETNASLRKGDEVASITVQRAAELLADRRIAPPSTRRRSAPTRKKDSHSRPVRRPKDLDLVPRTVAPYELKSRSRTNPLCGQHCRYAYAVNFRAASAKGGADRGKLGNGAARRHHAREPGVLSIKPFRRLWIALSLSSLGDWLSIVALTVLAPSLATGGLAAKGSAVGGVWLVTLLPALLFGPLAGAVADRLDRRMVMIIGDVIRGLLFLSIPLFPNLTWILVAKFLAGVASQFWNPATAASIPNLVPKDKLERANQLSLLTTYGTAPLAAGLFSVLALVSEGISRVTPLFHASNVDLALYFNAASYGISALTVYFIREIPKRNACDKISVPSVFRSIWEGWRFIGKTPVVRGLVIGMVGAFAGAGVVVGLGYTYITYTLHGGSAGWGLVFAAIFVGMALGMVVGTRVLGNFSRRRLFGLTIAAAAVPLALIGLVPVLGVVVLFVVLLGALSGIAYATGFTIVGLEVDDDTRGRVFAFFQSSIQVILFTVIVVGTAPLGRPDQGDRRR